MAPPIWGATRQEWDHFRTTLRLADRLWPVVSNPTATISPASSLKKIGKVPSRYDSKGLVVGIHEWPERSPTEQELNAFSRERDYGICIKTGDGLFGIDIDVELTQKADELERLFYNLGCRGCCVRFRLNSPRRLIFIRCNGAFGKRVGKSSDIDVGIVELLGKGQQFVAAGTHESGERYQWRPIRSN